MRLKSIWLWLPALNFLVFSGRASDFKITYYNRTNNSENIGWTNVFTNAITAIEQSATVNGPWMPLRSYWDKGSVDSASFPRETGNGFLRLLQVDVSPTPTGYTNLVNSYGIITTMAGNGAGGTDGVNYWHQSMEGGYATNAALSRPHIATADGVGNVYIADKDSHSILKVTPDGRIHTVAGTHVAGSAETARSSRQIRFSTSPMGWTSKAPGFFSSWIAPITRCGKWTRMES